MRKTVTATVLALGVATVIQIPGAATAAAATRQLGDCAPGALCLWQQEDFRGSHRTHELSDTGVDSCVPLPQGSTVQSFANRTGRPVTTYQDAECGETGEFDTFPGDGTWVPRSAYRVRAFKIWER